MTLLNDLMRGLVVLAFLALAQNGFSVKKMAEKAAGAHKKGLTSYQTYSNQLTGYRKVKKSEIDERNVGISAS